ncbi:MAG TPA: Gfo/Idh/MocA family oxidoreductase [Candidatus Acidoferrales bacterium]|nr:Gfo/Idh/MocA family oxidoreductase [Candidatus Acidoferrales bacterium]
MKQVIRRGLKEIIVDEVPDPVVAPHHVLIRPVFSLISSGTETASIHQEGVVRAVAENPGHIRKVWDVMKVQGPVRTFAEVKAKFSEYAVLGYAGAGVIAEVHPSVTDLQVGDRVAYGGEGTGHGETILAGRNYVARVPDGLAFEHACFATLGSIALNSVRIAEIGIGDVVVVLGLGLVGQLACQLVRQQGGIVIASDLRADRLELAKRLGAQHVIPSGASPRDAVLDFTNGNGADCVIITAAAKSDAPSRLALDLCRERGRIVVVGVVDLHFPWNDMYLKEIRLLMSRAYGPGCYDPEYERSGRNYPLAHVRWTANRNMEEFLRKLAAGEVQVQPLITHEFPLEDAASGYATILNPAANSLAVVVRYPEASAEEPAGRFVPRRKIEVAFAPASPGEIGVALVGAGNLARWTHLPNLKKLNNVRLQAVHSTSGARGKNFALRFRAGYCTSELETIWNDPEIDAVVIVSRNQHHAPQALAALNAGKHVFVEKPMALTMEECRALYRAVQQSGKHLTVGFNRRFAPFYVQMKRQLEHRGGPAVLNCRVNSPGISGAYWMADPAIGGAILGEACHFVDLMYWLLQSEPVEVSCYSLPVDKQEPVGTNNLVASFRFADSSIGNLTYCTVGSRTSGGERVEVFAPGIGTMTENFKHLSVKANMGRDRSSWFPKKGYQEQMESFIACIREGKPQEITVLDGMRATLGCLRMLESARAQEPRSTDWKTVLQE